ncbi:glycosyl hydrolase family 18 protein [Paenibacillus alginolyticus]|uniref:glycosyl hydrolase family 18 protein n=1 Tax=Paenibacillus alginolyticus TaxID=59839 RepID=UPI001FE86239|nr:glycosyl hydrolase family 18 protein [Paenibacillus frigoriresistens]
MKMTKKMAKKMINLTLLLTLMFTMLPSMIFAAASGAPGTPNMNQNNWDNSPNYTIGFDMWWGNNGSSWKLYENGAVIHTSTLTDNSPNAQSATFAFTNKPSGTYVYKVDLINSFGTQTSGNLTYTVINGGGGDLQAPSVPANLASTGKTSTSIALSWSASTDNVGVTGYEVYDGSTMLTTVTGTSFNVTGLTANTSHTFTVKAKDAAGNKSAASNAVTVVTDQAPADTQSPTVPTNLAAAGTTATSTTLTWTAASDNVGVTGYEVYAGSTLKGSAAGTTINVTGLTPNTTYSFTVKAKDAAGNLSAASSALTITTTNASTTYKKIGYFASWGVYSGRNFKVQDIDASKVTHINFAFADICWNGIHGNPSPDSPNTQTWSCQDETGNISVPNGTIVQGDPWADTGMSYPVDTWDTPIKGSFGELKRLKAVNPHLKTIISVGGWSWSNRFSDVAADPQIRANFANSAVNFLRKYSFDGVDLDWEYPVSGGLAGNSYRPADKQNYTLLLQEIRNKLDAAGVTDGKAYTLTIAAGASKLYQTNTELDKIAQYCDWINIMTYDFHGGWDAKSGQNAPLYFDPADNGIDPQGFNAANTVQGFLDHGVTANKLVMGLPFYGRGWDGCANTNNGLYQSCAKGSSKGTVEPGSFDYWDIEANYVNKNGYVRYWNDVTKTPWLYNASTGTFITYDDAQSFQYKTDYIKSKGLAGGMFWEFSGDKSKTLLNALSGALPH